MGSFSIWHWLIVLVIVLLLFGAGKLPSVMGDLAKGMKAFKAGLKDDEPAAPTAADASHHPQTGTQVPPAAINPAPTQPAAQAAPVQATATHPAPTATPGQPHPADPGRPHQG
ncbi:twin-arginine translocase TatA/TatE family subunit [Azospirillum picis]|uniref:Sec-independent protein translocase protein TatA n=1 Tax=Azospirillum picis TaxID=488438 RepID=A0ABU0MIC3_9PROT|nr:twin-arginine translocase TatA/TatE family subunit [Azospirillum picis]MBP2299657.1 sec-independent protein translocase protein TatA [Azospirillum picis]MDQ0533216.1 sec-independent protein translocase protein TatA [Azospirillum picis]